MIRRGKPGWWRRRDDSQTLGEVEGVEVYINLKPKSLLNRSTKKEKYYKYHESY
jgi:hypothetical protein